MLSDPQRISSPTHQILVAILLCGVFVFGGQGAEAAPNVDLGVNRHKDTVFKFMPIPMVSYNRSLGGIFGLVPLAMYPLNKQDTVSPASMTGGFGMYTTNESWAAMAFGMWYFDEDNWRLRTAVGGGNINFQFYLGAPINGFVNYATAAFFGYTDVKRRVVGNLYAGVSYVYLKFDTDFNIADGANLQSELHGIGVVASFDGRDDVYYPRSGPFEEFNINTYPSFLGNERTQTRGQIKLNHFFPTRNDEDVVAARVFAGIGFGNLDFQQQFIVGNSDLRGYTQGAYRGDQVIAVQGEYRWNPLSWLGGVAFGGVATVFNPINQADEGILLPAGGVGFRIMVFEEYHMNVGMDVAAGKDDWGVYFRIGEAF